MGTVLVVALVALFVVGCLVADKFGEAETRTRRDPNLACVVELDGFWLAVRCHPRTTS